MFLVTLQMNFERAWQCAAPRAVAGARQRLAGGPAHWPRPRPSDRAAAGPGPRRTNLTVTTVKVTFASLRADVGHTAAAGSDSSLRRSDWENDS